MLDSHSMLDKKQCSKCKECPYISIQWLKNIYIDIYI